MSLEVTTKSGQSITLGEINQQLVKSGQLLVIEIDMQTGKLTDAYMTDADATCLGIIGGSREFMV